MLNDDWEVLTGNRESLKGDGEAFKVENLRVGDRKTLKGDREYYYFYL